MQEIVCGRCDTICQIDGDYPKFFAWCYGCRDYAAGFDSTEYAADWMDDQIDATMERLKYEGL